MLPPELVDVPYVAARYPGSPVVAARPDLSDGAGCQRYAYAAPAHFGLRVPPLRSSDLRADRAATHVVAGAQPLDLLISRPDQRPVRRIRRSLSRTGPGPPPVPRHRASDRAPGRLVPRRLPRP